jgi:hypothetical protein
MERWQIFSASPAGAADALEMLNLQPLTVDPSGSPENRETYSVGDSHVDPTLSLESLTKAAAQQTIEEAKHADDIQPETGPGPGSDTPLSSGNEQAVEFLLVDDNKINLQVRTVLLVS